MNDVTTFEQSMKRLDEIVSKLESGKLSLEESISLYSEGVKLSESCRTALKNAELSVKTIGKEDE